MVQIYRILKGNEKRLIAVPETDGEAEILEHIALEIRDHNLEALTAKKPEEIIHAAAQPIVFRYGTDNPVNKESVGIRFRELDKRVVERRITNWIDNLERKSHYELMAIRGPDIYPANEIKDQWSNGEMKK